MENIAPIQIAEPKREKRAAVTAAYRRGYADALEDMRKAAISMGSAETLTVSVLSFA